jgi:(p)ppGpp synthase/HD superfamily hydrolase
LNHLLGDKKTMTQEIYQKAIKFAGEKYRNQKVPGTESNYLLHISNVAMEILLAHRVNEDFDLNYAVQLALLHDTLEDGHTTFDWTQRREIIVVNNDQLNE